MAVESRQKWAWGFGLFILFAVASTVLIDLLDAKTWTGFFPVCFAIGSCIGSIAGLIVYASEANDSYDQNGLFKSAGVGVGTWLVTTLLLPIALIGLGVFAVIWLLSPSGNKGKPETPHGTAQIIVFEKGR